MNYLNNKKEAYSRAVDCYSRTKDRGCKEEMDNIKYSFSILKLGASNSSL